MTDQLKSLAARIERLMDERDGIGSDIRDIFAEAKSHGYVPKVLRKAITRKRMDPNKRDEEDAILELYEGALGAVGKAVAAVRAGATWKEAAEDHGVPRATLARAVAVSKRQSDTKETQELRPAAGEAGTADTLPVTSGPGSSPASIETGRGCGPDYSAGVPAFRPAVCGASSTMHSTVGVINPISAEPELNRLPAPPQQDEDTALALRAPDAAIICAVTGDGEICPNTCAREGRCVWAPDVKESLTADPWDAVGPIPAGLVRVR